MTVNVRTNVILENTGVYVGILVVHGSILSSVTVRLCSFDSVGTVPYGTVPLRTVPYGIFHVLYSLPCDQCFQGRDAYNLGSKSQNPGFPGVS